MVHPKPVLCALLLLAFLGTALGWTGPHSCSVHEVLRHYQAVIFQDLQAALRWAGNRAHHIQPGPAHHRFIQKNLTGAGGEQAWLQASCDAQKERSILLLIESLGRTLRGSKAGVPRNALEKAAWTVAVRTEAVMHRHCRTSRTSRKISRLRTSPLGPRIGRKRILLHALYAVATCWEKLFALHAMTTRGF